MRIQRYIAKDMRSALAQVREALGPDAVILSSGRVGDDVEIVAAMDFEVARAVESAPQPRVHASPVDSQSRAQTAPEVDPLLAEAARNRRASSQLSGKIATVIPVVSAQVPTLAPAAIQADA